MNLHAIQSRRNARQVLIAFSIVWGLIVALPSSLQADAFLDAIGADVARIMDSNTSMEELDRIDRKYRLLNTMNQGYIAEQRMRNGARKWHYNQLQRQAEHQTIMDANRVWNGARSAADQTDWLLRGWQ